MKRTILFNFILGCAVGCSGNDDSDVNPVVTPDGGSTPPVDAGPTKTGIEAVEDLAPGDGWTIHVPRFEVAAGTEITDCYFLAVPDVNGDGSDVWIDRFKVGQRPGSHHMNIFRVNTVLNLGGDPGDIVHDGECKNLPNWADWPLVVNSQDSEPGMPPFEWNLPTGVAQRFKVGELVMLQTHYVNATRQASPEGGEVKVNFYKSKDGDAMELGTYMGKAQQIRICEHDPRPVFDARCAIPADRDIHIAAANGHFHSRGTAVNIYAFDGKTIARPADDQMFYQSKVWADPPMMTGLDVTVPGGGGFWWTCEYEWAPPPGGCDALDARDPNPDKDCCYTFGNTAEMAEHCNVFVYYWPKVDYDKVFCDP